MFEAGFFGAMLVTGLVGTAFLDLFGLARARLTGGGGLGYALLGRWLLGGRAGYPTIRQVPSRRFEAPLGWFAHYMIGIALAALPCGLGLGFGGFVLWGAMSVIFPLSVMQPLFGFGFAGRNLPDPSRAQRRSFGNHLVFGLGLGLGGWLVGAL